MNYVEKVVKIDGTDTKVGILKGYVDMFTNKESGIFNYENYLKYIQEMVSVPVDYCIGKCEGKDGIYETRDVTISRELASKFSDEQGFNSERYHKYIERCEALV